MCDHPFEDIQFSEHGPPVCGKCGFELTGPEIEEKEQSVYVELRELDSEIAAKLAKKAVTLRKRDLFARRSCDSCGEPISYRPGTVPLGRGRPREVCDNCKEQKAKARQTRYWANHPNKRRTRPKSRTPRPETLGSIPPKIDRALSGNLVITR